MKALATLKRLATDFGYMVEPRPIDDPKFGIEELEAAKRYFEEHGWVIVRNVFRSDEIERFRLDVIRSEREGIGGDLLSNPYLGDNVADERIVRIAKALLTGEPTYFGDAGWNSGTAFPIQMGFHKDNPDKDHQDSPDWRSPYTIIRMGVYLQDHVRFSGGLGIRDRSHNTVNTHVGRPVAVPTEVGDVVIWSLRTSHSGFVSRLQAFPRAFVPIGFQNRLAMRGPSFHPEPLFRPAQYPERLALFITFGVSDHHLRRYVRSLKARRYAVKIWQASKYTEKHRALLASRGVRFIDVEEQVRHVAIESVPEKHAQLPDDDSGALN